MLTKARKDEPQVFAAKVRARRDHLERDMRSEGWSEKHIADTATDEVARRMLDNETRILSFIEDMFAPRATGGAQ